MKRNARSGSERLADEAEAPAAEAQDAERGETDDEPPKAKRKSRLGLGSGSPWGMRKGIAGQSWLLRLILWPIIKEKSMGSPCR